MHLYVNDILFFDSDFQKNPLNYHLDLNSRTKHDELFVININE